MHRWRANNRAIHTSTPSGGVLLDLVAKVYFTLNPSGETLWRMLERGAAFDELVGALCREFDVEPSQAAADVERWLAELSAAGLVERIGDAEG